MFTMDNVSWIFNRLLMVDKRQIDLTKDWYVIRILIFSEIYITQSPGDIHKNLFPGKILACGMAYSWNMLYICDYVFSHVLQAGKTILPEFAQRSFLDWSLYGRRNNSVVISCGFVKARPANDAAISWNHVLFSYVLFLETAAS